MSQRCIRLHCRELAVRVAGLLRYFHPQYDGDVLTRDHRCEVMQAHCTNNYRKEFCHATCDPSLEQPVSHHRLLIAVPLLDSLGI